MAVPGKTMGNGRSRAIGWRGVGLAVIALVAVAGTAQATHPPNDTQAHTTVEQTLIPAEDPRVGYTNLTLGPGEPYVLRDAAEEANLPAAQPGREGRRVSLAYFSQLTDFQLADEESPARVEFADPGPSSAWRPQEGFTAFQMEATVRQINEYAQSSPILQGDATANAMDFSLLTGDQADNQQLNETVWVRDLLEGRVDGDLAGTTNFNSGVSDPAFYETLANVASPSCAAYLLQEGAEAGATTPAQAAAAAAAEAARYTGVQDYDDYPATPPATPLYYDPDEPLGPAFADWPEYDGLMDRGQMLSIDPEGLEVPFYITNGNHDVLVQGNEDANAAFEDVATGCFKALGTTNDPTMPPDGLDGPDPSPLLSPANVGMLVAPDPDRRFVSKPQIKEVYGATDEGAGDDDHGFAYVDPEEDAASNGSASYYAWSPAQTPGVRFISIDTNSEGGQTAEGAAPGSSNGNLDDPQFQWLKGELQTAQAANQLIVIFGHHPVRSMNTEIRDEQAVACTTDDEHGHDQNPGCDLDPRPSAVPGQSCIHNGTDAQNTSCPDAQHESFVELLDQFPNAIAYVPGHTHEHRLTPFVRSGTAAPGTVWWEINTSAVIDHPNQSRLVEIMDNKDGTLSIFNTVVDHASPATAPADCPDDAIPPPEPDCAALFTESQLASIGRTLTYNDPDNDFSGEGRLIDRNAELLLEDPRLLAPTPPPAGGGGGNPSGGGSGTGSDNGSSGNLPVRCAGRRVTIFGTTGSDRGLGKIIGTRGPDVIVTAQGHDRILGRGGNDVICAGAGRDSVFGGGGNDRLFGSSGNDKLYGGGGNDRLRGRRGLDLLSGGSGRDSCDGGGRAILPRGASCEQKIRV